RRPPGTEPGFRKADLHRPPLRPPGGAAMSGTRLRLLLGTALALATAAAGRAGGPLAVDVAGHPVGWATGTPLPYVVALGPLGQLDDTSAVALLDAQFGAWGAVPTASIRYQKAGELTVDVNVTNYGPYLGPYGGGTSPRGQNVVVFDADGSIFEDLFGRGTSVIGF